MVGFKAGFTNIPYAEISASDNPTETAIGTINVWVQCLIFDTNGPSNNATPDHTNDHITILKSGKYLVMVSASVLSGVGAAFDGEFEVKKNDGGTDLENIHSDRDLIGGGGDHGSISMTGIADFSVGDTIEVWCRNKTNTTNVTFEDVTLSLIKLDNQFPFVETGTRYLSISPAAFISQYPYVNNIIISVSIIRAGANGVVLHAPVSLPHGAVVIACEVYGNAAASAEEWYLRRSPLVDGSTVTMATANINTEDTTISYATIDNANYIYGLTTSSMDTNDDIYGARIIYTI